MVLNNLIWPVTGLLDKFIEDKDQKAALAHEIATMGAKHAQELAISQIEVNKAEAAKDKLEAAYKDRLHEVEKLVMPLLVNLLKTSDKEYIYWPDRKDQVEGQIDKLLSYTRD